jgi:predicted Zn-dependent protease
VRFLMDDSTGNAGANRDTVRIGRPMAEIANWDEAEIAALTAHELAHAVLDHQTWLEHHGSARKASARPIGSRSGCCRTPAMIRRRR